MNTYLAHEDGSAHPHEEMIIVTDDPQPQYLLGSEFAQQTIISSLLILFLVVVWLLMTYVFKLSLATRILMMMGAFLVIGIGTYTIAPLASVIALAGGIGLALFTTLLQLAKK